MRVLDLFAGIGGFSLAAHWMGWETAAFVEKEPFCHKVLRKNFGEDIEIHEDIFHFDGRPFRGAVDIITGGFPCQPFSAAGKRKGRDDERHLFPQMLRVISEVRPRWVVAENVRGLLSIESGRVFAEVVTSLESEGYEVITFCVPASALEAPHRRDRLWIIAHTIDGEHRAEGRPLREAEGISGVDRAAVGSGWVSGASGDAADARREYESWHVKGMETRKTKRTGSDVHIERCNKDGADENRAFGNPKSTGQPSGVNGSGQAQYGQTSARDVGWSEHWIEAATRFCRMDDGLPDELHIVGSRDNRVSRLKALGNAIVPQIAFEIFRAIEAAEKL